MYQPHDGVVAPLRTSVMAACDAVSLLIKIDGISEEGSVLTAPQVRRDQVWDDQDHLTFFIDPTGAGTSAMFFRVGAGGSLADGIYYASSNRQDLQPDFNVEASAERKTDGYSVTLRIPRSLLSTQGKSLGTMGYLVLRNVPGSTRRVFASSPLAVNTTNLIADNRKLDASNCGEPIGKTSFGATYIVVGDETKAVDSRVRGYDSEFGASFQWSNGSTASMDFTFNPDFSQVELDVPQLQSNMRFAINLPEKRDFFLRDIDMFELPTRSSLNDGGGNQAFYSRTITDPDWGARLSYRNHSHNFAFLAVDDNGGGVVSLPGPFYTRFAAQPSSKTALARVSANKSASLQYGAIVGTRRYGMGLGSNSVVGTDITWRSGETMRSRALALLSQTTAATGSDDLSRADDAVSGSYLFWDITKMGRRWETAWAVERASLGFRNDLGYTPQSDFTQISGLIIRRWRPQAQINNIGASLKVVGGNTTSSNELINRKIAPGVWFGGARDLDLLIEYVPGERRRTSGYGGTIHTTDQWNFRLGGKVSRAVPYATFSFNIGDQIDYELDRTGSGYVASLSLRLRPLEWLELQPTLSHYQVEHNSSADRIDETTGQIIANAIVSPSSFIRYIGQTRSNRRFASTETGMADDMEALTPWRIRDNRGVLHSLVYSLSIDGRWGLDLGVTRSRTSSLGQDKQYETNAFIKLEGVWSP